MTKTSLAQVTRKGQFRFSLPPPINQKDGQSLLDPAVAPEAWFSVRVRNGDDPSCPYLNSARISSIRRRFAPKSEYPTREAERTWICRSAGSNRNSTSSTKRKTRLRNSTCQYASSSTTNMASPAASTAERSLVLACARSPVQPSGGTRCAASSCVSDDTQLGEAGQGLRARAIPAPQPKPLLDARGEGYHIAARPIP